MAAQVLSTGARGVLRLVAAPGFGLVQVVWSCGRGQATEVAGGGWRNSGVGLCSLGILQNNFEIFGIFARFLSIGVDAGAGCRLRLVRLPGLVKGMGFKLRFLACRLNDAIVFYDCVAGRVLQITEILLAQALLCPLFCAVLSKGERKEKRI